MKRRKWLADHWLPILRAGLRSLVFPVMIWQILTGRVGYVYLCVLTLVLMALPGWAGKRLGVQLPGPLEGMILLFLFASEILGEIGSCYVRFSPWDGALHGVSGFFFGAVGFVIPELLGRQGSISPLTRALFALCFSMTAGVLWEFLEWGVDALFGLDMQKDRVVHAIRSVCLDPGKGNCVGSIPGIRETVVILNDGSRSTLGLGGYLDVGLHDTMGDLLVNLAGALVFVMLSRFDWISRHLVPVVKGER